jgi:hypothetical protein
MKIYKNIEIITIKYLTRSPYTIYGVVLDRNYYVSAHGTYSKQILAILFNNKGIAFRW